MTAVQLRGRLFITVAEAAQVLEVDPRTLRRSIDAGEFPAVRVAASVRIPVAKFLDLCGLTPETVETPAIRSLQPGPEHSEGSPHRPPIATRQEPSHGPV